MAVVHPIGGGKAAAGEAKAERNGRGIPAPADGECPSLSHHEAIMLHWFKTLIVDHLVANGGSQADAQAFVGQFGDGHLLATLIQLIGTYGPQLAQILAVFLSMFSLKFPIPTPPAPAK